MPKKVCRCPAYPWPHSLGGGKCDRSADDDATAKSDLVITIINVLDNHDGVFLSLGDDDYYYVGINYPRGRQFTSFENPQTDFCSSSEWSIAKRYFEQHTGGTQS